MSSETRTYAKQLGVEVITEYELNEFSLLFKTGKLINETRTGLTGIIIGKMANRSCPLLLLALMPDEADKTGIL